MHFINLKIIKKGSLRILAWVATLIFTFYLGEYNEEIYNFTLAKSHYKYLEGDWNARWSEDPCIEIPKKIQLSNEHISITHVYGKLIYGIGFSESYGKYKLRGKISDSTIVLTYERENDIPNKPPGVVILTLDRSNIDSLHGFWAQNKGDEIVHGITKWIKLK